MAAILYPRFYLYDLNLAVKELMSRTNRQIGYMSVAQLKTMTWILCLCFFLVAVRFGVRAEKVLGVETGEFDFDGLPGAHYEFKVDVGGGRDDCYYQRIPEGGNIYVSFEVSSHVYTVLVLIKLTKFAVPLRLRCGFCKLIF